MDFDRYADNYRELLDRSVTASGETGAYFAGYKARYLARELGPDFSGKILDYGCGIGLVTAEIARLLPRACIQAFDESEASIANVSPELREKARFSSNFAQLEVADVIVVANVLHHVPVTDRPALLQRLGERLANGGRFVIFEHNPKNPLTVAAVRDCPFDEDAVLLPSREALDLCTGAGLSLERRDYIVFFPRALSFLRPLEPALGWLPIGAQYAVVARKERKAG